MFKKRAAKQEQVDIGLEKIEKQQQGEGSDDEGLKLKTKKKIKPNPRDEEEEDDSKKRVQEIIDAEMDDLKYKSNENMIGNRKDLATVYNEIDTDENVDARAIALKRMEISQLVREGKLDSNVYRGKNYSTQYTTKSDEQIRNSKVTGAMGPVRAPANVRMTCRFDYDPSLCKDYHDTGYCVFGDSCLYLHDRGDYKNGQEQELEWEREQKRKQKALQNGEEEDSEADEVELKLNDVLVPKECQICGSKLRYPVKTICDHFFCEDCALKNYATSKTCYVCERNTQGVFSDATNIIIKLRKERQQEKKKLKFTVTSRKALKMLEDSEDSDDDDNQGQHVIISTSKGKKQKKKKEAKEVEVERTYVDENGIEITETILQRVGDDSDNDENDNEENDSQNGAYDEENEEENDVKKQGRDSDDGNEVEMQLALNATNRANKRQKFKASASDWAIV